MSNPQPEEGRRIALRKGRMAAEAVVYALIAIWALIMIIFPEDFHAESHLRGHFYATLVGFMPTPIRRVAFLLCASWASIHFLFAYAARKYDYVDLSTNEMVQMFDWKGTRHSVPKHSIENLSFRPANLNLRAEGHRYTLPYRFLQVSLEDRRAIRSLLEKIARENAKRT